MSLATAAMTAPGDKPALIILAAVAVAFFACIAAAWLVSRRLEKRSGHQSAHRR